MKIRGTDFVMFEVSDLARAAKFYRETLGLTQEIYDEQSQWAEFDCGEVTLSLHGQSKLQPAQGRIALAVENVKAACAELKSKGARVGEPSDFGVCQVAEVPDPDGNIVLLHHRADGTFGRQRPDVDRKII